MVIGTLLYPSRPCWGEGVRGGKEGEGGGKGSGEGCGEEDEMWGGR